LLCTIANVSRSGYYKWLKTFNNLDRDYGDYVLIKEIFDKGKSKYGWRTIQMKLKREKNMIMNHKKIIRIKNKYGLITKIRKKNPYKMIMKKSLEHRTCDNILNRKFKQDKPRQVACTDITYIPFKHRFAYLSVVKDIATKEIIAWNILPHLQMELVLDTINNLDTSTTKNMLIHSDQGFHYTNPQYITMIQKRNMIQSMSRKANCIDNAPIESFFGHLKDEIEYKSCKNFTELKNMINEYMNYYNYDRPQWNLKKMTPVEYRNHLLCNTT
jgi:transposase InsO family protein